jgi:lactaldehyde dehydrogenase/glycolaldehyde dehydrogenase
MSSPARKKARSDGSDIMEFGQWIGNKNVPSGDSARIEVENPTDHSILGTVPAGCAADAEAALALAKAAQPTWAKKPSVQRAAVLKQMATVIRENRLELIDTLVKEQAKILPLATVEIDVTADYYDYHAGMARTYEGEILQSDNAGEHIYVHRAPIGVSVGIVPWNFPFFVMARKIAPALLAGCTVVVKSSEVTPLTSFKFCAFMEKAIAEGKLDLEPGIIAVLTGYGATVGDALCKSPIPGIISLTGSLATGQIIMRNAAENMTKVSLELGGKAPVIVMEDADLDKAVDAAVASRVIFTGQGTYITYSRRYRYFTCLLVERG